MKEKIKLFIHWLLASSEDPQKVSAMVKGLLMVALPKVVLLSGLLHLGITDQDIQPVIDGITVGTTIVLTLVGTLYALFGAVRKIKNKIQASLQAKVVPEQHDDMGEL